MADDSPAPGFSPPNFDPSKYKKIMPEPPQIPKFNLGISDEIKAELSRARPLNDARHMEASRASESINLLGDLAKASTADEFCRRINAQIKAFDDSLDQEHEVGVKLVTFGQSITFHVERLGYHNPSLIFFYGATVDGDPVQLIQNVSQISFVLVKMRKPDPEKPKRPFGFRATPDREGPR